MDVGLVREPFNTEPYDRIFLKRKPGSPLMSVNHPLAATTTDTIELRTADRRAAIIRPACGFRMRSAIGSARPRGPRTSSAFTTPLLPGPLVEQHRNRHLPLNPPATTPTREAGIPPDHPSGAFPAS